MHPNTKPKETEMIWRYFLFTTFNVTKRELVPQWKTQESQYWLYLNICFLIVEK